MLTLLLFLLCVAVFIWIVGGRIEAAALTLGALAIVVRILVRVAPFLVAAIVALAIAVMVSDKSPPQRVLPTQPTPSVYYAPPGHLAQPPQQEVVRPELIPERLPETAPSPSATARDRSVMRRKTKSTVGQLSVSERSPHASAVEVPALPPAPASEVPRAEPNAPPEAPPDTAPPPQPPAFQKNNGPAGFEYDPNH